MLELLQWLGVGGVTGGFLIAWLAPSIVPAFAARALAGAADGISEGARHVGYRLNKGGAVIFSSGPATFTLIVAMLLAGWAGDRYEFVRPVLPSWLQSEPKPVTEYKRKEAEKARAKQAQRPASSPPTRKREKSAFEEITCALKPGGCAQ